MSELAGLLLLAAGLGALASSGALAACCLRLGSPLEFLVAGYVLAWSWIVAVVLVLSPVERVERTWLVMALGVGLLASTVAWQRFGRPRPPSFRPGLRALRAALALPAVAVLALAVALGSAYTLALAFLTPVNEGDALAYHLARAAFWRQEQAVGYVANAVDLRLDVSPPNAEIGQLATILLSGGDRYVALPQLAAYAALVACVAALARRVGLTAAEATFGALVFATLPIVAVQASGALNDLVVASFLAAATLFALTPSRAALAPAALALGLALGTKFTAVLALPALALVVALARPRTEWPRLLVAGAAGAGFGCVWYLVNLVETGDLDGGLAADADQRVALTAPGIVFNALRYGLDLVDLSGLMRPYLLLVVPAAVGAALLASRAGRPGRRLLAAAAAFLLALSPLAFADLAAAGRSATTRAWSALGRPETPPFERGWELNDAAGSTDSWFGPVGLGLLVAATAVVLVLWRRRHLPAWSVGLVVAPWMLLAVFAATVVWDPWRGRFLVFGVALAAATWGVLLRSPAAASATSAVAALTLVLSLVNLQNKPIGLWEAWEPEDLPSFIPRDTIWDDDRAEAQARARPGEGEEAVYDHLAASVPDDAALAFAARENDFVSPYFGSRLSRRVSLVRDRDRVPASADWLVLAPSTRVQRCADAWRPTLELESGWRVERRAGPDDCLDGASGSAAP